MKSHFDPPHFHTLPLWSWGSRRCIKLDAPWLYRFPDGAALIPDALGIYIPQDFVTDGASVPRLLTPLLSPIGVLFEGGIIHDYAYQIGSIHVSTTYRIETWGAGMPRQYWDELLRDISIQIHGDLWIIRQACRAIEWGAQSVWQRYRQMS